MLFCNINFNQSGRRDMRNTLFDFDIYTKGSVHLWEDIKEMDGKVHVISGNAEVLKLPLQDIAFFDLFQDKRGIIIPDGISVYLPVKKKDKTCKKLPGIEFMQYLLTELQNTDKAVYFLGAKQDVVSKMIARFTVLYPGLKIAGYHNGYFDKENCSEIISYIKESRAFALFVALGTPAQEKFIFRFMDELPCKIFMGVGGSFDVLSGTVKRGPQCLCKLGLEWLYRLIKDPSKIGRLWNNISFTIKALLYV
jgi:N-acetylglucosaminyldiphosphoundecaprenol N-acetyl-beta-D-mannosaminyltransferase